MGEEEGLISHESDAAVRRTLGAGREGRPKGPSGLGRAKYFLARPCLRHPEPNDRLGSIVQRY